MNSVVKKNEIKGRTDIHVKATHLRNKVFAIMSNRSNWEKTKIENSTIFNNIQLGNPYTGQSPKINLYEANDLVVNSIENSAGFNMDGQPCQQFSLTNGNDNCLFRYEIKIVFIRNLGSNIFECIVRAELFYKPRKLKYPFNPSTSFYSFEQMLDCSNGAGSVASEVKAKEICTSVGGIYNSDNSQCSVQITSTSPICSSAQIYSGSVNQNSACQARNPISSVCPPSWYLAGFDENGPICRQ